MPTQLLKYSDTDDSIILKSTLLDLASITAPDVGSGTFGIGTTTTFDSANGMTPGANGGAKFQSITGYQELQHAGQISIDIDTNFIGYPGVPAGTGISGSNGKIFSDNAGNTRYLMEWDDGGAIFGRLWLNLTASDGTGVSNLYIAMTNGDYKGQARVTTLDKGTKTRVAISWVGNQAIIFLDSKPIHRLSLNSAAAHEDGDRVSGNNIDLFKNIYVGAYRATNVGPAEGCYFKNLLISTQPVSLTESHAMGTIAWFGHSYVMTYGQYSNADSDANLDAPIAACFENHLIKRGQYCKEMQFAGIAGGAVSDAGTSISAYIAKNGSTNLLDYEPDYVFIVLGTNDLLNYEIIDASAFPFESEYKKRIDEICTGTGSQNIKKIFIFNVPTVGSGFSSKDTQPYRDARAAYNESIDLLPAYGVANGYPTIEILDLYNALGAENAPAKTYYGQYPEGVGRSTHLTGLGNSALALIGANALLSELKT